MKCPYCAEEIKDEAVVCRYCHRELTSVRLNALENLVKQRLAEFSVNIKALEQRLDRIDALPPNERVRLPVPQKLRFTQADYFLIILIGSGLPIISVFFYLTSDKPNPILLILPFFVWFGVGMWAYVDPDHSVKRYLFLGAGVGLISSLGIMTLILMIIYGWGMASALSESSRYLFGQNPHWGWTPLLLIITPLSLTILGGFTGEWLESKRPSGQAPSYPRELANRLILISRATDPAVKEREFERLTKVMTVLAPLIAAVGGIVVPIITILLSR